MVENLHVLTAGDFTTDLNLINHLINMEYEITRQPLGIPLASSQNLVWFVMENFCYIMIIHSCNPLYRIFKYSFCNSHFANIVKITKKVVNWFSIMGITQRKVGKHTTTVIGRHSLISYHHNKQDLKCPYRISMILSSLLGQMSYNQKAKIYNIEKGYDTTKEDCSTIEKDKVPRKPPVHRYVDLPEFIMLYSNITKIIIK